MEKISEAKAQRKDESRAYWTKAFRGEIETPILTELTKIDRELSLKLLKELNGVIAFHAKIVAQGCPWIEFLCFDTALTRD